MIERRRMPEPRITRWGDGSFRVIVVRNPRLLGDRILMCLILPFWFPLWLLYAIAWECRKACKAIWRDIWIEMRGYRCIWRSGVH